MSVVPDRLWLARDGQDEIFQILATGNSLNISDGGGWLDSGHRANRTEDCRNSQQERDDHEQNYARE